MRIVKLLDIMLWNSMRLHELISFICSYYKTQIQIVIHRIALHWMSFWILFYMMSIATLSSLIHRLILLTDTEISISCLFYNLSRYSNLTPFWPHLTSTNSVWAVSSFNFSLTPKLQSVQAMRLSAAFAKDTGSPPFSHLNPQKRFSHLLCLGNIVQYRTPIIQRLHQIQ